MTAPIQYAVAEKALSNKYTPIIIGVLVVGTVVATYFIGRKILSSVGVIDTKLYFIGRKILSSVGVIDTKFDKRIKYLNGFDPNYYKKNISKVTISTAMAQKLAEDIHDSYGFAIDESRTERNRDWSHLPWDDLEELLINAIQSAGSEYNLSKVSDVFQLKYTKNMAEYIYSFADNVDTETIYKIIKSW